MFGIFKKVNNLEAQLDKLNNQLLEIKTPFIFNIGDKVSTLTEVVYDGVICHRERIYYRIEDELAYAACNSYKVLIGDRVCEIDEYQLCFTQVKYKKNEKKVS